MKLTVILTAKSLHLLVAASLLCCATAFVPQPVAKPPTSARVASNHILHAGNDNNNELEKTFGGYTAKQRLREEVESPFRTVRLFFFGSSTGSALVALYFSILTTAKSSAGFPDAPPLPEALQSVAINVVAALVCGAITYRDWKAGDANLARIKQGGALAKLVVQRASSSETTAGSTPQLGTLADYRRNARVLIAAGGKEYIQELCRSLNADQLADRNTLPAALASSEIILVPVLLKAAGGKDQTIVGDTSACWKETTAMEERDRNFDITRANDILGFPRGPAAWAEVLEPEVETAVGQGFDVLEKGITLILKKNGKILRRATGQPQWSGLVGTMEVLDGSKFGMPGDDEKYGSGKKVSTASREG